MGKVDIETDEFKQELNEVFGVEQALAGGFKADLFSQGIVKEYTEEDLIKYFQNPEKHIKDIEKLAHYYYITNGDVFQQFDLAQILPTLNHKVEVLEKSKNYETNTKKVNAIMKQVGHKELTRDLIGQLVSAGTLVGIWLGTKKDPYLYVFDDLQYVFPARRVNGKWTVWIDLEWFDTMGEIDRETQLENLFPHVLKEDYQTFKEDPTKAKYVELPLDRSVVLRTHTLKRNQRFGISWATQGLFDVLHKKKLKDLEKSVANKIINSIAVLTIGNKETPNLDMKKGLKRKIYGGVKSALQKNSEEGVTCIAIPEFSDIKFPEMKSDALDPKKFEGIDGDISNSTGVSRTLTSGTGGNFASAKVNYEIIYKKISVLLEHIESEVYQKLINMILPKSVANNYGVVYDKKPPITQKEQIEILMKLHAEGFGVKPIIAMLDGIDFMDYINQSLYELQEMELNQHIQPYSTAYTNNGENQNTKQVDNTPENSNTENTKTNNGNETPSNM